MFISNAGAGRSDILALVYSTGLMPEEGEPAFSLREGYRQSEVVVN